MLPAAWAGLVLVLVLVLGAAGLAARTPIRRGEPRVVSWLKMLSKRVLVECACRAHSLIQRGRFSPVRRIEVVSSRGVPPEPGGRLLDTSRRRVEVLRTDGLPLARSRYPFAYQPLDHPRLRMLRERFDLDGVVAGARSDLERALALAAWVRAQIRYGPGRAVPHRIDGLEILERGRRGESFLCGMTCLAFAHCLQAVGLEPRALNIAADPGNGHVVTEVWDGDHGRWVLIDADNGVSYRRGGVPLSALDLHRACLGEDWDSVELVQGDTGGMKAPDVLDRRKIPFYANFAVKMRNDWLSAQYPPWHPVGSCVFADLEWTDEGTPGRIDRAVRTGREEDLYWTLGRAEIRVTGAREEEGSAVIGLALGHCGGRFQEFEVRKDGEAARTREGEFSWRLESGVNRLEVRAVDELGRLGPSATLEVRLCK